MSAAPSADPRGFASDNHSGAHPEVLEAIARANVDHAGSYGEDGWTKRFDDLIREHFGPKALGFPVFNGTAANVLAIDAVTRPQDAVVCVAGAHIDVDECGAPERWAGVKLLKAEPVHGKLEPAAMRAWEARRGDIHHNQPRLVSVAESTEVGTVYTLDQLRAIADEAHGLGMLFHVDGARLANAAAALDVPLGALAADAGADVLSLGATKNGGLVGDAVVFLDPGFAEDFELIRKQGMQLASKMRFLSAQFDALFGEGDLWRRNAEHANAMAARLAAGVSGHRRHHRRPPGRGERRLRPAPAPRHRRPPSRPPRRAPLLRLGRGRGHGPLDVLLGHDRVRRRRPVSPPPAAVG